MREFVVIAIADCSLVLNGNPLNLKAGEHKTFLHQSSLQLDQSGSKAVQVVLVQVLSWKQELIISADTLTAHQSQEDASDRNATLLIAITPLNLADTKDLAEEGDAWISSRTRMIALSAGATTWLPRGIHRIKNLNDSSVQFVTIEW